MDIRVSLKTRGIEYNDDINILMYNIENVAKQRSWKPTTLSKFKKYIEDYLLLKHLNDLVIIFGEAPQASIKEARHLIKQKVLIGIFDLELSYK